MLICGGTALAGPVTYYSGTGHWYQAVSVLSSGGITWDGAQAAADGQGGYLATVLGDGENTFVYNLVNSDQYWGDTYGWWGPWLGGSQTGDADRSNPAGGWSWDHMDETWSYTYWRSGEPNNNGGQNENRLQLWGRGIDWGWNDQTSNYNGPGYIIEWNSDPTATPEVPGALVFLTGVPLAWARLRRRRR